MRHLIKFSAFLTSVAFVFLLTSCTNGSDDVIPSQDVIQQNVQSGSWKITSFIDSGKDETNHFNGYSFNFGANGTLTAIASGAAVAGTWNVTDSNSGDDSLDDLDFNILFNLGNDFDELSEDWSVVSQSSSRIELIHVSGGNGGTDHLTFEKK
jgi:hypothetical protein